LILAKTFNSKFFYIFFFFICQILSAQEVTKTRWQIDSLIVINSENFEYRFPARHILQKQSLRIRKNNISLNEIRDYKFSSAKVIQFYPIPKIGDSLFISYRRLPVNLKENYALFKKDTLQVQGTDSTSKELKQVRVLQAEFKNPFEDFGSGLQKSGSIMRGVNIGTNRDLTLNSGLNLELSGQLSEDIEIVAALTDESTPIQPEGNTQTLDEVDQVFIQFKSPFVEGTVGDLNLKYQNTRFGNLSRKLQGVSLLGKYNNQFAGVTVATTRGFFNRVVFIGQEGNQGPYQLTGKNGEREIIVLAGTERVWINGQRLLRGESNDYIIEYANGQLTFTNNRLVTSESRIEIDFEYFPAIQKYSRSALSGLFGGALFENKFNYKVSFYQEKDNIDNAVGQEDDLTKEEKNILKLAGDDFQKASVPGEKFVGENNGSYSKKDTISNDSTFSIFEYKGAGFGDYSVTFTFVGKGLGDYVRDRLGQYRWVGENSAGSKKGEYMPIKLIPLPQTHQLTDFFMEWKPTQNISLSSEYAISNLDRNSSSKIQDSDNPGNAFSIDAKANKLKPNVFGLKIGEMDFGLNSRIIDKNFQSVDRFNSPDFQRYWNVLQESSVNNEEKSVQFNTAYRPFPGLGVGFSLGNLDRDNFKSTRYSSTINFNRTNWFKSDFRFESVTSELSEINLNNRWRRFSGNVLKDVWKFQPQFLYQFENRRNDQSSILSGFRFDDFGLRLGLIKWQYFSGFVQTNQRNYQVYDTENDGSLVSQSVTNTNRLLLELQNVKETTASLEIIQRRKNYSARFEEVKSDSLKLVFADAAVQDTVWQDRKTNLAELRLSHSRWKKAVSANLQYRISTEQTALREKVYIPVSQGRGNFRFDEDLEEYVPDPDGDFVLFILPSGKFEPVTKLESALRLNYDPSRFWRKPKGGWQSLLSNISGSSYFRLEEETQEKDLAAIYLLDLSKFQQGKTLRGSLVYDQDIYLMKRNRKLNFRLQYRYRDDLFNQFLDEGENEDRKTIERGFRTDWKISSLVKSQSEIRQKTTKRESKASTTRNREIEALFLSEKIFYRPFDHWEFRFITEYGQEENKAPTYPIDLWFAVGKIQGNYVVAGKGRITADFEYQVVKPTSNPQDLVVPFEMARGKKEGISKKWQLRAEYTVSKNILFTFLYNARDEAGFDEVIQTGQAEVRAFF